MYIPFPLMSPYPFSIFFCLPFVAGNWLWKQSCKALMFRPTTVKHFNLFDVLASDDTCVQIRRPDLRAMRRVEIPNEFSRNAEMRSLSMGASAFGNAQKRCRKVINHVPRLRDILRMQSSLSGEALHRSSFVRCPVGAFMPARFRHGNV